ncbi:hypothetical protein BC830DRAFT_1070216, partial [Chytriomyces sp. MP71]
GLYPGIVHDSVLGSDGCGTVLATNSHPFKSGDAVIVNPARGWAADPDAPENVADFNILGLGKDQGTCTFAQFISVHEDDLARAPAHLGHAQAAALPLAGLTAYRAVVSLGKCKKGDKVLIPGIGGGVALFALQFALALGADVWVTSSSPTKIERAVALGAKGGVNYKSEKWPAELESASGGGFFNLIVDGASGPNLKSYIRLLAPGSRLCIYGAVAGSAASFTVPFLWFKHVTIVGVCMGSRREFHEMVDFVDKHKIVPVIHAIYENGFDAFEEAFRVMRAGEQFGKIVVSGLDATGRVLSHM